MKFSEKIRQIREEHGLTQEALAHEISVKPREVINWEKERLFPEPDTLRAISQKFDVGFDELFTAEDIVTERVWQEKRSRIMAGFSVGFLLFAILLTAACNYYQMAWFGYFAIAAAVGYIVFSIFGQPKYKRVSHRRSYVMYLLSRSLLMIVLLMILVVMIRWWI